METEKYCVCVFSITSLVNSPRTMRHYIYMYMYISLSLSLHVATVQRMWHWFTDYIGTIQFDPNTELAEIPNHSAFFILSPENRSIIILILIILFCLTQ